MSEPIFEPVPQPALPESLTAAQQMLAGSGRADLAGAMPAVYRDLRALAGAYFDGQPAQHTLQPTALVNEVYVKLVGGDAAWADREHFLALAATVMRQVLIDHARAKSSRKRGADWQRVSVSLVGSTKLDPTEEIDIVALDRALTRLESLRARQARIVELRFLAGMTTDEIAGVLGVSRRTVELEWRGARAWLRRELDETAS